MPKTSKKKNDIIQTATQLFNQHGYNAVGVDRIISESNVAKMTFYKYFTSKEVLIESCLVARSHQLIQEINETMSQEINPLARLKALFFWYKSWFDSPDFYGCLFQKAIDEAFPLYPLAKPPTDAFRNELYQIILTELLVLNIKTPKQLSILLMSILEGLTTEHQVNPKRIEMDVLWDYVERLITR